jgi:hypothetical protein
MHPIWFSTLCLSLLILTGCGAAPTPAQIPTEPGPETVLRVLPSPAETIAPPPPTVNPSEPSPGLEALILGAKADLAGRLALKVEQITLVTWAAVTWPLQPGSDTWLLDQSGNRRGDLRLPYRSNHPDRLLWASRQSPDSGNPHHPRHHSGRQTLDANRLNSLACPVWGRPRVKLEITSFWGLY